MLAITMLFSSYWHLLFDLLAYLVSAAFYLPAARAGLITATAARAHDDKRYWQVLVFGAVAGAFLFGSLNLSLDGTFRIGHSVAGALLGAIVTVEIYKWQRGIIGSTGSIFVLPTSAGISVGRLGCFFAGLSDGTYGVAAPISTWAVDFGDGIRRYPVQLYEASSMAIATLIFLSWRRLRPAGFQQYGFYVFVLVYSAQRWVWEFLKPYPLLLGPFNVFHLICLLFMIYALFMIVRTHAGLSASTKD